MHCSSPSDKQLQNGLICIAATDNGRGMLNLVVVLKVEFPFVNPPVWPPTFIGAISPHHGKNLSPKSTLKPSIPVNNRLSSLTEATPFQLQLINSVPAPKKPLLIHIVRQMLRNVCFGLTFAFSVNKCHKNDSNNKNKNQNRKQQTNFVRLQKKQIPQPARCAERNEKQIKQLDCLITIRGIWIAANVRIENRKTQKKWKKLSNDENECEDERRKRQTDRNDWRGSRISDRRQFYCATSAMAIMHAVSHKTDNPSGRALERYCSVGGNANDN